MSKTTGAIILAAGNSSRLGRPKQLVPYRGQTLLTHTITQIRNAGVHPVVVVTGAFHEEVSDSLDGQQLDIVFNPAWEEGMASGIVAGLSKILKQMSMQSSSPSAISRLFPPNYCCKWSIPLTRQGKPLSPVPTQTAWGRRSCSGGRIFNSY